MHATLRAMRELKSKHHFRQFEEEQDEGKRRPQFIHI